MRWGVYDTTDNLWYGTDDGPKLFDHEILARACAQVIDVRLQNEPGRSRAREWPEGSSRVVDERPTVMTTLQALKHIERGGL